MASRHDELMNRIHNAQVHAGEQEVLKHLAEIEGRKPETPPKTFNDGLEAAALYLEQHADKDGFLVGRVPSNVAAIRTLKEPTP